MTTLATLMEFYTRINGDRSAPWLGQISDWFVIAILLLVMLFILRSYDKSLQQKSYITRLQILLAIHVLFRYIIHREHYSFYELLPLYSCSVVAILLPAMYFNDKRTQETEAIYTWSAFAGIYGGALAIFLSAPSEYNPFHIINTDYYVGHFLILIIGVLFVRSRPEPFSKRALKQSMEITLLYLVICLILNPIIDGNYAFLSNVPKGMTLFNGVPLPIYQIMVIGGYLLANYLTWFFSNIFLNKKLQNSRERSGSVQN